MKEDQIDRPCSTDESEKYVLHVHKDLFSW